MWNEEPVGLVDLVEGFPTAGVTFIGLLAIVEDSMEEDSDERRSRRFRPAHANGSALRLCGSQS